MSYYKAISDGNADTLSIWETWDGAAWVAAGSLPTTTDDVYTNNFIVTVTTSQAYNSWNRSSVAAPLSITQGGQFRIDGANDILISGEIYGTNVTQSDQNPLSACVNRLATHTGTISIIGNQNGGSANYTYGFFNNSTFDVTSIVGNQQGGSANYSFGFYNNAASTFKSIVGNQQGGGGGSNSYGFFNNAAATFTSIVGNQNGGNNTNAYGFYNNAVATFTSIVGNQQGGGGSGSHGFYNYAASTFTSIVGNQQGGSGTNSVGFRNYASGSTITFENSFQKTGVYQGVYNTGDSTTINFINCRAYTNSIYNTKSTATINFQGITYNDLQNGTMAIRSLGNVNFDLSAFYIGLTPTYTDIALYPASTLENPPAESDVRSGVVYGIGDAYEGTLVQTSFAIAEFIAALKADDLGKRMGKCATTEEVDMTVASYNT